MMHTVLQITIYTDTYWVNVHSGLRVYTKNQRRAVTFTQTCLCSTCKNSLNNPSQRFSHKAVRTCKAPKRAKQKSSTATYAQRHRSRLVALLAAGNRCEQFSFNRLQALYQKALRVVSEDGQLHCSAASEYKLAQSQ